MKNLRLTSQKNTAGLVCTAMLAMVLLQGCSSIAPVTTSIENGRLLPKGKIEGTVLASSYSSKVETYNTQMDASGTLSLVKVKSSMETLNNNLGLRVVAGGEHINVGFHYERLHCAQCDLEVNYFAVEPKFRLCEGKNVWCSFSVPLGIYMPEKDKDENMYQLMPSFHFTYSGSKYFEFTFSPKTLFILNLSPVPLMNITAGFGFSSDLSKWAIRPEVGYTFGFYGGNGILQTGIGIAFCPGN